MRSTLEIDIIEAGARLRLRGRLDARTTPSARARLHQQIDDGAGELELQLGGLEIWDGAGLGVLVGVSRRVQRAGRQLVLTDVGARELRLLRVARLTWNSAVHPAEPDRVSRLDHAQLRTSFSRPIPENALISH